MNVQEAGDAARFYHTRDNQPTGQVMKDGGTLELEGGVCKSAVERLVSRGHNITRRANQGGYQVREALLFLPTSPFVRFKPSLVRLGVVNGPASSQTQDDM